MFTITCPKCEDEIEFSLDDGEELPTIDEWIRDCGCAYTEEEERKLQRRAEDSVADMDPPGDY